MDYLQKLSFFPKRFLFKSCISFAFEPVSQTFWLNSKENALGKQAEYGQCNMLTNIKEINFQHKVLVKFILKKGISHVMLKCLIRTKFAKLFLFCLPKKNQRHGS